LSIIRRYVEAFRLLRLAIDAHLHFQQRFPIENTMSSLHNIPAVLALAVAGALVGYAAYRRSAKRTAQKRSAGDLRSELCAERESLRAVIEALPAKIDLAKQSRMAAALGAGNIGPDESQRLGEIDLDLSEAARLRAQLSAVDIDYESLSDMDVEVKLVEVLALSLRAGALTDKYCALISMETDRDTLAYHAEALIRAASQYSVKTSGPPIAESVL
jgi:hypothetical protein